MKKIFIILLLLTLLILSSCSNENKNNQISNIDWEEPLRIFSLSPKAIEYNYQNGDYIVLNSTSSSSYYLEVKNNEVIKEYYKFYNKNDGQTVYEHFGVTWIKHHGYIKFDAPFYNLKPIMDAKLNIFNNLYEIESGNVFFQVTLKDNAINKIKIIRTIGNETLDILITQKGMEIKPPDSYISFGVNQETSDFLNNISNNDSNVDDIDYDTIIGLLGKPSNEERLLNYILLDYYENEYMLSILIKDGYVDVAKLEIKQ